MTLRTIRETETKFGKGSTEYPVLSGYEPSPGIVNDDTIVDRERVGWKASDIPRTDLDSLAQCFAQRKVIGTRDVPGL